MDDDKHKREVVGDKLIVKYCKPSKEAEVELLNCPFTCAPHPVLHPPVTQTPSLPGPTKNLQLNGGGGANKTVGDDLGVSNDLQTLMSFQQVTPESDSEMMECGQVVRENGRTSVDKLKGGSGGVESTELDGNDRACAKDKGKAKCVGTSTSARHVFPPSMRGEDDKNVDGGSDGAEGMELDENDKLKGKGKAKRKCASADGRRVLPSSIKGQDKNLEQDVMQVAKSGNFKELLEAISVFLVGNTSGTNDDKSADFIDTAISKGMDFPRPRWWPPEGFEDESSQH